MPERVPAPFADDAEGAALGEADAGGSLGKESIGSGFNAASSG
jgi:hypothetical protein